jgi:cytoskeletal protein CcmA (bactofilin family)
MGGALEMLSLFKAAERKTKDFAKMLYQLKVQGRKAPKVIDNGIIIKGDIEADSVMINCSFSGSISSKADLIVGKNGHVKSTLVDMGYLDIEGVFEGDIQGAKQVQVKGTVVGNITAERLIINGTGCVNGQVSVKQFRVAEGGKLEGGCAIGVLKEVV